MQTRRHACGARQGQEALQWHPRLRQADVQDRGRQEPLSSYERRESWQHVADVCLIIETPYLQWFATSVVLVYFNVEL